MFFDEKFGTLISHQDNFTKWYTFFSGTDFNLTDLEIASNDVRYIVSSYYCWELAEIK